MTATFAQKLYHTSFYVEFFSLGFPNQDCLCACSNEKELVLRSFRDSFDRVCFGETRAADQ